jgi:Zn finger protein HypA/HybF involved in hydrogenase expression
VSPVQASCPACGGPVKFKVGSSVVTVCEYCHSVVARGDRKLVDLGKVADLTETGAVLEVGLKGRYQGVPFDLTGRVQLRHEAGGVWDEWYAHFADGRWGWLAEAQGRFYLTFEQPDTDPDSVPPYAKLKLGQRLDIAGTPHLLVAEKGTARALGAEGEIPYRLEPGRTYTYADLSGTGGEFATLDYGDTPPTVYLGRQVSLDELGVPKTKRMREREARQVEGVQLNCPNCGGPLELRAPDRTERVGCPNCGGLLDVSQGKLRFLKALERQKVEPAFPLGSVATFRDTPLTLIGFMQRSVIIEGVEYFWEEYLLYEPRAGFRWLVRSDDHWNFVEAVPPGEVSVRGRVAYFHDKRYKLFQKADAGVTYVVGEFYWKVEVGEVVRASDFIRPPEMLSRETSTTRAGGEEVNWSLGTYLPVAEVEKAFGAGGLPRPAGIAPNQPFLYKPVYLYWGLLTAVGLVLGVMFLAMGSRHKVFEKTYTLQPLAGAEKTQVFFSDPFELRGRRNIEVTARANVDNSWIFVEGDLVEQATQHVQPFPLEVAYYHGVDEGEAWNEGSKEATTYLSAQPAGTYTLRLEVEREKPQLPASLTVRIEQGVPHVLHWVLALGALAVVPVLVGIYHFYFESQRWKDSDYSPFQSS